MQMIQLSYFRTRKLEQLLTIGEACGVLAVSRTSMYRLTRSRQIEHFRVGAKICFSERQLHAYLDRHRRRAIGYDEDQRS
ncbi:MAG: hypothetical protein CL878_07960 [Dehalococcoidia bacterium]|nr:hypothetical protein [Dehalococcoidia bacterium]